MRVKIEFSCDNDAFKEDLAAEATEIFERCVNLLRCGAERATLRDSNGNTIGVFSAGPTTDDLGWG